MELEQILTYCDHTLLKPDCRAADIRRLCDEAIRYHCASVCVPPCHVAGARRYVENRMRVCTVVGFPHGTATTAVKVFEAKDAVHNGADEIDMVVNLSMVKDGCWAEVANDIRSVRAATNGVILKVIIECCKLTEEEKIRLCQLVADCGADYIKTSTGFAEGGATPEDVALMRRYAPERLRIKAAGGITSVMEAANYLTLGASRLGTSRMVRIAQDREKTAEMQAAAQAEEEAPEE